ncbi:hypothetical protein [Phycicoccus sonneratiae]|uniref:DUF998 domain-containing protein n=1 Tax=Phycicoccus sonneratiae TaxID=2807628 RepID=A0ABS2CHF0_9MICO|nr:hypothetical protein [Phycicoccus sonneraticus]MBM6399297.1 hypothetical protein [Phycicoccus sonneraticus]
MKRHHLVAAVLTAPWVVLLGYDFSRRIATGRGTWVTDGDLIESPWLSLAGSVGIGAMFASLAWVVAAERDRFALAPRAARWARRPLLVSLVGLTVGLAVLTPTMQALDVESGLFYDVSGLVAFLMVLTLSLSSLTVGLASIRNGALGWGGRILALVLPVAALGVGASLAAGVSPSPVFGTSVAVVGLATLGLGATPVTRPAPATA